MHFTNTEQKWTYVCEVAAVNSIWGLEKKKKRLVPAKSAKEQFCLQKGMDMSLA